MGATNAKSATNAMGAAVELDGPISVVDATGVAHLRRRVVRPS